MIIDTQKNDEELQKKVQMVREGDKTDFSVKEAGSLYSQNRLYVPYNKELEEAGASNSNFSVKEAGSLYFQKQIMCDI